MKIFWTGLVLFGLVVGIGMGGAPGTVGVQSTPGTIGPSCHGPQTVMVPQTFQVPKQRTVKQTIQVPEVVMVDKEVDVVETYYEPEVRQVPMQLVPMQTVVPQSEPGCSPGVQQLSTPGADVGLPREGLLRRLLSRCRERRALRGLEAL